jgi:ATP adenylyltransferase
MDVLWSPWRNSYVTKGASEPGCVLCQALQRADAEGSLVVHVGAHNFIVMNLYPYNAGHLMIAPLRHIARLVEATEAELSEMMALSRRLEQVLNEVYKPDGVNLGMNLGKVAGAGVEAHLHMHVVPRWAGDTNFMTVVGGTRVIPEDPAEACLRLKPHFSR